jgi:hypothetical protein
MPDDVIWIIDLAVCKEKASLENQYLELGETAEEGR